MLHRAQQHLVTNYHSMVVNGASIMATYRYNGLIRWAKERVVFNLHTVRNNGASIMAAHCIAIEHRMATTFNGRNSASTSTHTYIDWSWSHSVGIHRCQNSQKEIRYGY